MLTAAVLNVTEMDVAAGDRFRMILNGEKHDFIATGRETLDAVLDGLVEVIDTHPDGIYEAEKLAGAVRIIDKTGDAFNVFVYVTTADGVTAASTPAPDTTGKTVSAGTGNAFFVQKSVGESNVSLGCCSCRNDDLCWIPCSSLFGHFQTQACLETCDSPKYQAWHCQRHCPWWHPCHCPSTNPACTSPA